MPKIQTYGGSRVQAGNAAAGLNVRANPNDFGAGVGQAVSNIGNLAMQNAAQMKAKDDEAKVKEATNELRRRLNERAYLDEDAYYNRRGIEAYETFNPMLEEFNSIRDEVAGNLGVGRQQELFSALSEGFITNEHQAMSRHAAVERTNWLNGQDEAVITQAQQDGSLRYLDNQIYVDQINGTIANLAARNGWSPEEVSIKRNQAVSDLHVNALDNLVTKSPSVARDYFEARKGEILPELYDDIEARLKANESAVWVQDQAEAIKSVGGTRTDRLGQVNQATDDPDRRRLLRAQVEADFQQEKIADQEMAVDAYSNAYNMIVDSQGPRINLAQFAVIYEEQWNAMTPAQKASIEGALRDPTATPQNDLEAINQVQGMIADGRGYDAREFIINNQGLFTNSKATSLIESTYKDPESNNRLTSDARMQFNDWIEGTLGKEPPDGRKREEWNRKRNFLLGMYDQNLTEDNNNFQARRQLLDDMTREAVVENQGMIPWPAKRFSVMDLDEDDFREVQRVFDETGMPMTPESVRTYLELGIDFTRPEYQAIIEALEANGNELTPVNILTVFNNLTGVPVE